MNNLSIIVTLSDEERATIDQCLQGIGLGMRESDELIVLVDSSKMSEQTLEYIKYNFRFISKLLERELINGNIKDHKNYAISQATKDYIVLIDGDEIFPYHAIQYFHHLEEYYPGKEIFLLKRLTSFSGMTPNLEQSYKTPEGFPDWQGRIIKNHLGIKYEGHKIHHVFDIWKKYSSTVQYLNTPIIFHARKWDLRSKRAEEYQTWEKIPE